jgi:hypothetical protein
MLIFSLSSDRLFKRYVSTSLSERKLILVTTDFFHCISVETVQVHFFFKVRKSSSVLLESTSENIFPQISHKDVEMYLRMTMKKTSCYRQFIRGFNFY